MKHSWCCYCFGYVRPIALVDTATSSDDDDHSINSENDKQHGKISGYLSCIYLSSIRNHTGFRREIIQCVCLIIILLLLHNSDSI
jgi:hypothetical protein